MFKIVNKIIHLWNSKRPSAWIGHTRKQDTVLKTRQYELDLTLLLVSKEGHTVAHRL